MEIRTGRYWLIHGHGSPDFSANNKLKEQKHA